MKRIRWIMVGLAVAAASVPLIGWALGIHIVRANPEPLRTEIPSADDAYKELLLRIVAGERVDYRALRQDEDLLRAYVAWLETHGPQTNPQQYDSERARLAYYLNAYNALVLLGVVSHWPIESVHDVKGWVEPKAGFGFFWAQFFVLDGHYTNLYDLENDVIRGFADARIHAAINCASVSCPALQATPFDAERIDTQLDAVTAAFVSNERHVRVGKGDPSTTQVSAIFDWFRDDFESHARARSWGDDTLAWIAHFRQEKPPLPERPITFFTYDWALNRVD